MTVVLPALPHLPPAHHETSKHDSPNETKIKIKPLKWPGFEFKLWQVNDQDTAAATPKIAATPNDVAVPKTVAAPKATAAAMPKIAAASKVAATPKVAARPKDVAVPKTVAALKATVVWPLQHQVLLVVLSHRRLLLWGKREPRGRQRPVY
jgi:hypothetical protein